MPGIKANGRLPERIVSIDPDLVFLFCMYNKLLCRNRRVFEKFKAFINLKEFPAL